METRAHHILVGSFVVAVILLTLGSLLWLGKFGNERDTAVFDIVFAESVIGLSKGSVVTYNGVPAGEVQGMRLDEKNLSRVVVRVRITGQKLVRADTEATLGFAAVTGVADIRLSGGSASSPILYRGSDVPMIHASPSPLAKLTASGQNIMVNINELASRLTDLLSDENVERVSLSLANIEGLTRTLNDERTSLAATLRQLSEASGELKQMLTSVDVAAQSIHRLVDGDARNLVVTTEGAVQRLDALAAQLEGLLADNRAAATGFGQQGLRQVGPTLDELRDTLRTLQQLSEQWSRSDGPLMGSPQPKEFTPR